MLTSFQSDTRMVARPHRDITTFAKPAAIRPSLLVATSTADETGQLVGELAARGYRTAAFDATEVSSATVGRTHWDAIVLDIETAEFLPRHTFDESTLRILVIPAGHPDAAIRALTDLGAAAFIERPIHPAVLAAILSKLCRSDNGPALPIAADRAAKEAGVWHLNTTSWTLGGPAGGLTHLTRTETAFLTALAAAPGEAVPRQTLIKAMGYRPDYYGQRRLDTFVSRLRKKVAATCATPLPLRSIHAFGYAFTALAHMGNA